MHAHKAFTLAVALGADADTHSREARVRLTLPWGHVLLLDETGGEVIRSLADLEAHGLDNAISYVANFAKWPGWDGSELWARRLARLLTGTDEARVGRCIRRTGDGSVMVVYERAEDQVVVIGATGCYLYPSRKLWQRHLDEGKPGPEVFGFE